MTATDLITACHKLSTRSADVRCSYVGAASDVAITVELRDRSGRGIARGTEIVRQDGGGNVGDVDASAIVAKATKAANKELKATRAAIRRERAAT